MTIPSLLTASQFVVEAVDMALPEVTVVFIKQSSSAAFLIFAATISTFALTQH